MSATMTLATPTELRAQRRDRYHEADVVVVGAGIFGCAIAHAMAAQGRSVLLLERWLREPDRIVGELLQPGGVEALRRLGLGHCLEGIDAVPCRGMTVFYHGRESRIPYPGVVDDEGNVDRLWGPRREELPAGVARPEGRSFHHGRLIGRLRRACAASANISLVETEATAAIRGQHGDEILGVEARTVDPETGGRVEDYYFGQLTIVADGYDSKFRKRYLPEATPLVRSKFYALELIDCPLPRPSYGHVIIGKASPVLLYQIGTRETRALIDVPQNHAAASPARGGVRGYIRDTVLPTLPAAVQPSVAAALDRDGGRIPRSMPNSWMPAVKQRRLRGMVFLGDALNMRHPLTGGGMTVAFNDAILLSELLSPARVPSLGDAAAVRGAMDAFYWRRKRLTANINVLAQALYSLFAADDRQLRALQMGCFEYFERGITDGPCGLLAGIIKRPDVLALHFFSVAMVAVWMNAVEVTSGTVGWLKAPLAVVDAVLIIWRACVVFLPIMFRELM